MHKSSFHILNGYLWILWKIMDTCLWIFMDFPSFRWSKWYVKEDDDLIITIEWKRDLEGWPGWACCVVKSASLLKILHQILKKHVSCTCYQIEPVTLYIFDFLSSAPSLTQRNYFFLSLVMVGSLMNVLLTLLYCLIFLKELYIHCQFIHQSQMYVRLLKQAWLS